VELDAKYIRVSEEEAEEGLDMPTTPEGCKTRMEEINQAIKDVSERPQSRKPMLKTAWI